MIDSLSGFKFFCFLLAVAVAVAEQVFDVCTVLRNEEAQAVCAPRVSTLKLKIAFPLGPAWAREDFEGPRFILMDCTRLSLSGPKINIISLIFNF